MLATLAGHDDNTKKNLGEFQTLILGISTDEVGSLLTDTIMVASYNPNTQRAVLLSIPRDTYTGDTPSKASAYDRLNSLYSKQENPQMVLDVVNKITGLNIKNYIIIKTEAFIKLVDAIGGINYNVPINMNYDDYGQDLHIHLNKGEQLLDGDKSEQLVRFRHNNDGTTYPDEYGNNDTGRMRTQREFVTQVLKQTLKPENIFHLGEILNIANEYVITNIQISEAKDYLPYAVDFNTENLSTGTLPGENTDKNSNKAWVFLPDEESTKELIQKLFYNTDTEETESSVGGNSTGDETSSTVSSSELKIEVLNGSGQGKLLQKAVDSLTEAGYNVTRTGNTQTTSKTTIVNPNNLKDSVTSDIKNILGVGTVSQTSNVTISSKVDLTVILGQNYK